MLTGFEPVGIDFEHIMPTQNSFKSETRAGHGFQKLVDFTEFDPSLWALAKLHTYGQQSEPFLHADGDVYIWEPFDKEFLESGIFAQNIEYDHAADDYGIYKETFS